ncbi:MAG: sulfotransferase [Myxococcota bacterium]
MQDKLLFVIGSPRSGSTMLQRMIGSHSAIFTHPEPHLMTPLAHLGYYHTVDKAPFDHINAAKAMREFVDELPGGEQDYLDACRAYADTLYGRMLSTRADKLLFLDKTPAYALVTDFLTRVYPKARYVVLTRHPLAILSSYANSFFDGDYDAAYAFNPILDRYVPAIARFLRRSNQTTLHHVRYEDLVQHPDTSLEAIFNFLGLDHESSAVEYGQHDHIKKSFGDPNVDSHSRPTTRSVHKWARELAADPDTLARVRGIAAGLSDDDLAIWGYPRDTLFEALDHVRAAEGQTAAPPRERINAYRLQRKVLLRLRKNIHHNQFGRLVKGVRYYCDVLLRD